MMMIVVMMMMVVVVMVMIHPSPVKPPGIFDKGGSRGVAITEVGE